jgi:hypothetical protein
MRTIEFRAYGHENIIGEHKTTCELTTEHTLTKRGTCIIGIGAECTLSNLDDEIKSLARSPETRIVLRLVVNGQLQKIEGRGSPGLTYTDEVSMVARTSGYECGRTLMVRANRAASDLDREFIDLLKHPGHMIQCQLAYINEE